MTNGSARRFAYSRRPQRTVWTILLLLIVFGYQFYLRSQKPQAFSFEQAGPFRVERVVDGDTLLLQGKTRVRLLGIDTPESVAPNRPVEPLGKEASEFTRSLVQGHDVMLQYDRERHDQHQRVLAYVFLGDKLINEEIIRAGFSRAETRFNFDSGMKSRFLKAEKEAREARRGLWGLERDAGQSR